MDSELSCGGGTSEPIIAIIDCRSPGIVTVSDEAEVAEGDEILIVPTPTGGILVAGSITSANQHEIMRLLSEITNRAEKSLGD